MRAPWKTEIAHGALHALVLPFLPDQLARRIHDRHASFVFDCTPEEAASSALPEQATVAFYRGVFVGALVVVVACVAWTVGA